ncbi:unnamed protein product [Ectocarpus sp. 12 AP-2014]
MDCDAATNEKGDTIGVLAPSSSKPVILQGNEDNGVGSPMAITAAPEKVGCFTLSRMEVFLRNRITDNPRASTLVRVNSRADMTPQECTGICADGGHDVFAVSRGDLFTCLSEEDSGGFLRGRGDGVCNSPCTGDASQTCGGHAAFDTYKIVSRGDDKIADGIALGDSPTATDTATTSTIAGGKGVLNDAPSDVAGIASGTADLSDDDGTAISNDSSGSSSSSSSIGSGNSSDDDDSSRSGIALCCGDQWASDGLGKKFRPRLFSTVQ